TAYEMMLSESQERMLIVARKGSEKAIAEIFEKWDLDACAIGTVTDTGRYVVKNDGEVVVDVPVTLLTDSAPEYERPSARPEWQDELQSLDTDKLEVPKDLNDTLLKVLSSPNIGSKHWIYRQYDHMVRTDTIVLPGSDSAVVRIKGTDKAIALTSDCNSRYCYLDPFTGGAIAVSEAARNISVSGAVPLALTDCLNFGNPERPEVMWQFEQAILGMKEACEKLSIPVVSGNVSLYNETSGKSIYPTPTIGMVGLIDDVKYHTTQWFRDEGDRIALLGPITDELGGSEYLKVNFGLDKGGAPMLDLDIEKRVQEACRDAIKSGIIKSAHDISDGGLAVAIAESCFTPSGSIGAEVKIDSAVRPDALLFGEGQSRILLSFDKAHEDKLKDIAGKAGVPFEVIGSVGGGKLKINSLI
ncbi:MAG: phosphoribosylformylglycinamidine synthase II, partial [Deltaproteobacteria bacterium]|nr:phosphoribosylformylglycinamidine synthase II [Deltaproteobacteria bacterium]